MGTDASTGGSFTGASILGEEGISIRNIRMLVFVSLDFAA